MKNKALSAYEYLSHPDFGPVGKPLRFSLHKHEMEDPPSGKIVQEALIAKGRLDGAILKPGEYVELIKIIANEYPKSFSTWLDDVITSIESILSQHQKVRDENVFPEALQPYFEKQLNDLNKTLDLVWSNNP